ncbi:MAG: hypothetical protein U1E59_01530 [Amaricoccus sp.]
MSAFDLVVRLFGLLLGLAMGEVFAGVVRICRLKLGLTPTPAASVRVGWLVPLLAVLILMAQLSFWLAFYDLHGNVPLNLLVLIGILLVIGSFFVISGLVFPAHPESWPDFDAYYFRVRRGVIGGLIAIDLAAMAYLLSLMRQGVTIGITTGSPNPAGGVAAYLYLPALVALVLVRGRRASILLLVIANAIPLVEAITRFR